jgi:transposase
MKTDARALDHKTLTELRKRAVACIQEGQSPANVARALGVNVRTVFRWLALYRNGGWHRLDASKRGGRPPKLDGKAMKWIYNTVTMKNPLQLKFPFALWTSAMIGQLIRDRFGVRLSRSSVCRLLGQLGLSAQRPLWRAYQQDPEAVRKWMEEEYPEIRRQARQAGAEIYFGDEAGVRSDFHSGTTWGVRGRTPIVSSTGARFSVNMMSAVSAQGRLRFMLTKGRVTAKVFIEFLQRLLVNASHPIFLIVDGHPSHKAKCVRRFVDSQEGRLQLFLLPSYSPELNPDELVWNDLKNNCLGRKPVSSRDELRASVISHLRSIQRMPALIKSFFLSPTTQYATI